MLWVENYNFIAIPFKNISKEEEKKKFVQEINKKKEKTLEKVEPQKQVKQEDEQSLQIESETPYP